MARTTSRPRPTATQTLTSLLRHGPTCGNALWAAYHNYRTITTLTDVRRLTLKMRRCVTPACPPCQPPYRPEAAGRLVRPTHEFGLDVIAWVGTLRHAQHRRVPEIHHELARRRIAIAPRTVLHLLERDDALVARALADPLRLQRVTKTPGRVILALDGLQPDIGHEGLGGLRDCLSAEVLLARRRLSATQEDVAELLREVKRALGVPIIGGISDGQAAIRCAVATALPAVPHQLCHFHSLRAAAKPVYAADRHAKQALKKRRRGGRPIARQLAQRTDPEAEVMRGDGNAVRRARTADGPPPGRCGAHAARPAQRHLDESGAQRKKGGVPKPLVRLQTLLHRGLTETAALWPEGRVAYRGVHQAAHVLTNEEQRSGAAVKRRLGGLLGAMTRYRAGAGALAPALAHFLKVSRRDWPGLFHCSDIPELPRTNNDLEQYFGAYRYHERRATGRTGASPALVMRGSVQLIAAMATRHGALAAWELAPEEVSEWKSLRHELDARRQRRTLRRRFRRDPASYLAELETALRKLTLPP